MPDMIMQTVIMLCTLFCLCFALFKMVQKAAPPKEELPPKKIKHWLLLIISIATLYVELVIIRWVGTEVRIFAFVQNVVLITCFLGFGVGCFTSAKPGSLLPSLAAVTVLAAMICMPIFNWQEGLLHISNLLTLTPDSALWGHGAMPFPLPGPVLAVIAIGVVAAMLWLMAAAMIPLGRWVGYCFDNSKNVVSAYTVNLAGSLIGSWLLLLLSVFNAPPAVWIGMGFALVLAATYKNRSAWVTGLAMLLPLIVAVHFGIKQGAIWSPYQKLEVSKTNDSPEYFVTVNNVGYMTMANTRPAVLKKNPEIAAKMKDGVYDSPFRFVPPNPDVLIVGAGAGNDASAALRHGAKTIDAVEIDPVIYGLGKKMHPDHPYDNKKVNVIINDARNYFRTTKKKYDAVIFGLLDSHTEVSGYTNMRVDNYVYTREAFEQARALLKPEGVLVLKFEVRAPWEWIGQRFYRTLTEVFGREPIAYFAEGAGNMWGGTVYLSSDGKQLRKRAAEPAMKEFLAKNAPLFPLQVKGAPESSTDDWPYPYNLARTIPQTYLTVAIILMAVAWFMLRKTISTDEKQTWPMFALGAGFMLMETQMISRLTLYFGTTWIVNSIAISTILCVLVLSNLTVMKWWKKPDTGLCIGVLIAALTANFFLPWEKLPYPPFVVGVLLSLAYAVAVYMAGIVFITTLKEAKKKSAALGANVMGSVVGGLSQNLSFIFGLKALLPLAALCYGGYVYFRKNPD